MIWWSMCVCVCVPSWWEKNLFVFCLLFWSCKCFSLQLHFIFFHSPLALLFLLLFNNDCAFLCLEVSFLLNLDCIFTFLMGNYMWKCTHTWLLSDNSWLIRKCVGVYICLCIASFVCLCKDMQQPVPSFEIIIDGLFVFIRKWLWDFFVSFLVFFFSFS